MAFAAAATLTAHAGRSGGLLVIGGKIENLLRCHLPFSSSFITATSSLVAFVYIVAEVHPFVQLLFLADGHHITASLLPTPEGLKRPYRPL